VVTVFEANRGVQKMSNGLPSKKVYDHQVDPIVYRLGAIIRGMGLTRAEVAARTGVSMSTVQRVLSGKRKQSTMYFRTVARIVVGLDAMHVPLISIAANSKQSKRSAE
jgi:transcriptional regulator with XRE-family HTH domain